MSAVRCSWTHKAVYIALSWILHPCQSLRILQVLECSGSSSVRKQMSCCFWPAAAVCI